MLISLLGPDHSKISSSTLLTPRSLAANTGKRTNRGLRNTCWSKRECEAMKISIEDAHTLLTCTRAVKRISSRGRSYKV
jgi:hypothetical protein